MSKIYESITSFCGYVKGAKVRVAKGDTVREGHPLIIAYPGSFRVLTPTFEFNPPPAPKKPEPVKLPPAKKVAAAPAVTQAEASGKGKSGV